MRNQQRLHNLLFTQCLCQKSLFHYKRKLCSTCSFWPVFEFGRIFLEVQNSFLQLFKRAQKMIFSLLGLYLQKPFLCKSPLIYLYIYILLIILFFSLYQKNSLNAFVILLSGTVMSVIQCHAFSIVKPKVGSSACIVRSTLTISGFWPMLNYSLYPNDSHGKLSFLAVKKYFKEMNMHYYSPFQFTMLQLVHIAVTLSPNSAQTLKFIHHLLLTELRNTTYSKKA